MAYNTNLVNTTNVAAGGWNFTGQQERYTSGSPYPYTVCGRATPRTYGGIYTQSGAIAWDGTTIEVDILQSSTAYEEFGYIGFSDNGTYTSADFRGVYIKSAYHLSTQYFASAVGNGSGAILGTNISTGATWNAWKTLKLVFRDTGSNMEIDVSVNGTFKSTLTVSKPSNSTGYIVMQGASLSVRQAYISEVAVPNAPTGLTATAGNTQAALSWTAPADNGGAAITDYIVQYKEHSSGSWSTFSDGTSTSTSATVTGLTNGTQYDFQVAAVNSKGTGTYSSTASATPATVPGAPTGFTATRDINALNLAWTAPADNGGSAVTGYKIYHRVAGVGDYTVTDLQSTSTTYQLTGLDTNTSYNTNVSAVNAVGEGSTAGVQTERTYNTPSVPLNLTGSTGVQQVTLDWDTPADLDGLTLTDHAVQYRVNGQTEWVSFGDGTGAPTNATVTGLADDTLYDFRVTAVTDAGNGPWTEPIQVHTASVPGQVISITLVDVTPYDFTIEWAPPVSDGGSPITDYIIEYRLLGAPLYDVYADGVDVDPTAVVGELIPATDYEYRIAAKNLVGTGPFSLGVSVRTDADIPAPLRYSQSLKSRINQLAGTYGEECVYAANIWAGTQGESFTTACNIKAGTQGLSAKGALNVLAGTTGENEIVAARRIGGYQ